MENKITVGEFTYGKKTLKDGSEWVEVSKGNNSVLIGEKDFTRMVTDNLKMSKSPKGGSNGMDHLNKKQ